MFFRFAKELFAASSPIYAQNSFGIFPKLQKYSCIPGNPSCLSLRMTTHSCSCQDQLKALVCPIPTGFWCVLHSVSKVAQKRKKAPGLSQEMFVKQLSLKMPCIKKLSSEKNVSTQPSSQAIRKTVVKQIYLLKLVRKPVIRKLQVCLSSGLHNKSLIRAPEKFDTLVLNASERTFPF